MCIYCINECVSVYVFVVRAGHLKSKQSLGIGILVAVCEVWPMVMSKTEQHKVIQHLQTFLSSYMCMHAYVRNPDQNIFIAVQYYAHCYLQRLLQCMVMSQRILGDCVTKIESTSFNVLQQGSCHEPNVSGLNDSAQSAVKVSKR